MPKVAIALLAWILAMPTVRAGETLTAADTTERGRSLDRILDLVLLPDGSPIEGDRTLVFLLDPTTSLASAGFPEKLSRALRRHASSLGETALGIATVGGEGRTAFGPASEAKSAVAAAEAALAKPASAFQNVYADLRRVAGEAKRRRGQRDVVLVTLENGDAEDDLEATVQALRQAKVRVFVVARQAFLSDTYWAGRTAGAPAGTKVSGAESAFVELPWGWLFQQGRANESVGSGFPVWGLSRTAEASGGRVFLYYPPSKSEHSCIHYGTCPFCFNNDHIVEDEAYQSHRLRALAPFVASRKDVLGEAARDPYYRALLSAWEAASKKGLVASRPSVKRTGGSLQLQKNVLGRLVALGSSVAFASHASKARKLLAAIDGIERDLRSAIDKVGEGDGSDRYRAMAEATWVQLRILRVNTLLYAAFCDEIGPTLAGRKAGEWELPEIPYYADGTRFTGIGWTTMSLCHGVAPYAEMYLPGGAEVREEMKALEGVVDPYLRRYAHTPFAAFVRKSGIARFTLTVRGKYVPPPKRKIPGSDSDDTTTTPDRPARGGPSGGSGGGPTTGGGRS